MLVRLLERTLKCDQIGLFLKAFTYVLLTIVAQIIGIFWAILKNINLKGTTTMATLVHLEKFELPIKFNIWSFVVQSQFDNSALE